MLFVHRDHPERAVRLAYCLNVHPAATVDALIETLRAITLPLRERLSPQAAFGVGMYFQATLARELASQRGEKELARLRDFLREHRLDPFTYNAFPAGNFDRPGLKADVFRPTWLEPERSDFTRDVARIAVALTRENGAARGARRHVSISTHSGMFGAWVKSERDLEQCAENMARSIDFLATLEEHSGVACVLSLEAEPRASAGDTRELARFLERARTIAQEVLEEVCNRDSERARHLIARHFGSCLDLCHAAVEFEEDPLATLVGAATVGKIQITSALALRTPRDDPRGVAALLALAEPRYLHQVTGRRADGALLRLNDLPELAAELRDGADAPLWLACDEWRVHFHVPFDLHKLEDAGGLSTTRADAERVLDQVLSRPATWTQDELHLEIETYTWSVLPEAARGEGALIDGLLREYGPVLERLAAHGWTPALLDAGTENPRGDR